MLKINKSQARKLYNEGFPVHILPCKMGVDNMWLSPQEINNSDDTDYIKYPHIPKPSFDKKINAFEYYNCNSELGYYVSYYIINGGELI